MLIAISPIVFVLPLSVAREGELTPCFLPRKGHGSGMDPVSLGDTLAAAKAPPRSSRSTMSSCPRPVRHPDRLNGDAVHFMPNLKGGDLAD